MTLGGYYIQYPVSYGLIGAFVLVFIAGLNDVGLTYRWMLSTFNIKHRQEWYRLLSAGFVHGVGCMFCSTYWAFTFLAPW